MPTRRKRPRLPLVLLVRHGQTPTTGKVLPGRSPGLHLSDKGRKQADAVAERLSALKEVAAVYASPLERARETAAPIAKAFNTKVQTDKGLMEPDIGDWTGVELKVARKQPEWKIVQRHPAGFRFPNGESILEMQVRAVSTLARLRAKHDGTVVAVSHADVIKAVVADAMGTHLDHFQRYVISPCSVTAIVYGETSPVVLTMNWVGSVADLASS